MARKDSPQSVIDSYRKRQQMMPFVVGGLAVLLVAVGIIILVVWFTGPNRPALALFASATPTSTSTSTPTPVTPTATETTTPTVTLTPTATITSTPTGPFEYEVQAGDVCWDLANTKFKVDLDVLLALNNFAPGTCPIKPGDKILIPTENQQLPTETSIPTDLAKGSKINYIVKSGETMDAIAARFNSTIDEIIKATNDYNKKNSLDQLTDKNTIFAGQTLVIPVNIVTATPTMAPTSTKAPGTITPNPAVVNVTATPK